MFSTAKRLAALNTAFTGGKRLAVLNMVFNAAKRLPTLNTKLNTDKPFSTWFDVLKAQLGMTPPYGLLTRDNTARTGLLDPRLDADRPPLAPLVPCGLPAPRPAPAPPRTPRGAGSLKVFSHVWRKEAF